MMENKRRMGMPAHILVVGVTAAGAMGHVGTWIVALALAHLVIDMAKTFFLPDKLLSYLADQALHVGSLVAIAALVPDLWSQGFWAGLPSVSRAMAVAAGLVLATRAGQFAVEKLLTEWLVESRPDALRPAAALIGLLERGIIFAVILAGELDAIGFLIAAKAIFQFKSDEQGLSARGFVIAGTFASFGWALAIGLAVAAWLELLPADILETWRRIP